MQFVLSPFFRALVALCCVLRTDYIPSAPYSFVLGIMTTRGPFDGLVLNCLW